MGKEISNKKRKITGMSSQMEKRVELYFKMRQARIYARQMALISRQVQSSSRGAKKSVMHAKSHKYQKLAEGAAAKLILAENKWDSALKKMSDEKKSILEAKIGQDERFWKTVI